MKFGMLAGLIALMSATMAGAQARSTRDTATAYGARLNAKQEPARINSNRINSRIDSRINNRLGLRIERYQVTSTDNPVAAFRAAQDDKSRTPVPRIVTTPTVPDGE